MNKFDRSDLFFSGILFLVGMFLFSLWFFLNANSPWQTKNTYCFLFPDVGTLDVGNPVTVNGLQKGSVSSVNLAEDNVRVCADILTDVSIPENSRVRIINTGLMGERTLAVFLGNSSKNLSPGSLISGIFDEGSSKLVAQAGKLFLDLESLLGKIGGALDSTLLNVETAKQSARMRGKMNDLQTKISKSSQQNIPIAQDIFRELNEMKDTITCISDSLEVELQNVQIQTQELQRVGKPILNRVRDLGLRLQGLVEKTKNMENTAGKLLFLPETVTAFGSLKHLGDSILQILPQKGLDLNADLF